MKEIVTPLLIWFKENKRDLEWRQNNTAYSVLVSEIMLQQTRAQAVRPYYVRFMKELPNFESLANCSINHLYKLWEGLGYYSRARNLKACAEEVILKYNGIFPKSYEQAIKLKGIGPYTCGAILSRAYNLKYAAIDGNVLRVLSRYLCSNLDISKESTKTFYKKEIEKIMPINAKDFNESLMELGACICMPKVTLCDKCPIQKGCKSFHNHCQFDYPKKALKKEKTIYEYTCLFITDGNKYIFVSKENGVLKDLPSPILANSFLTKNEALEYASSLGFKEKNEIELQDKKHIFTHQIWLMKGYKILVEDLLDYPSYTKKEIENTLSIPTAFKKFLNELF